MLSNYPNDCSFGMYPAYDLDLDKASVEDSRCLCPFLLISNMAVILPTTLLLFPSVQGSADIGFAGLFSSLLPALTDSGLSHAE